MKSETTKVKLTPLQIAKLMPQRRGEESISGRVGK